MLSSGIMGGGPPIPLMSEYSLLPFQAEEVVEPEKSGSQNQTTEVLMTFADEADKVMRITNPLRPLKDPLSSQYHLAKWFERPVQIDTYTMTLSGAAGSLRQIEPWKLFFYTNADNKAKLNHIGFFRCKLHIKVVCSATPFLYCGEMIGYRPLTNDVFYSPLNAAPPLFNTDYNSYPTMSQYPNTVLNVADTTSVEMELPFIFPADYLPVNDSLMGVTATNLLSYMGALFYFRLVPLFSANGAATDGVTVTTYCHAKDFEFHGATMGLAFQSKDEYTGPISGPASAVANLAKWFTTWPIIGRYATATQMGASALAAGASSIGYTNVPVLDDINAKKIVACPPVASGEIGFAVEKLCVDPKNELSIDGGIVNGPSDDELFISNFIQRKALVSVVTWSQVPQVGTVLFEYIVQPGGLRVEAANTIAPDPLSIGLKGYYASPVAHASQLFRYWRGDIILTFVIIKSPYHRGRLLLQYDPTGNSTTNAYNTKSTNCVISEVIDIASTSSFEVTIPYSQTLPWLQVTSYKDSYAVGNVVGWNHNPVNDNGIVLLSVLNDLSAPDPASQVAFLVYARAGKTMEFADPKTPGDRDGMYTFMPYQSNDIIYFGTPSQPQDERHLLNFGEAIVSFRQLLRRMSPYYSPATKVAGSGYLQVVMRLSRKGPSPGWDSRGLSTAAFQKAASGSAQFNYTYMTPLKWLTPCYLAERGSVNYTVSPKVVASNGTMVDGTYKIFRGQHMNDFDQLYASAGLAETELNAKTRLFVAPAQYTQLGPSLAITDTRVQSMLTVSIPYMNQYHYGPTNPTTDTTTKLAERSQGDYWVSVFEVDNNNAAFVDVQFQMFQGIGTDFTLAHFLAVPLVYYLPTIPLAV